jgi:Glycosyl transferases group 1
MSTVDRLPALDVHTSQPPARGTTARIVTDHRITQLPWWAETLRVLPHPGTGLKACLRGVWRSVRDGGRADVFVSANVRNALALGIFKRVTRRQWPLVVMTEMRLDDPQATLRWRLKVAVQRFGYATVDRMCVSARCEIDVYAARLGVPINRFRFVPWHTNVLNPRWCQPSGAYFFAAGRTGRDWATLAEAARGLDVAVTVVCTGQDAARVRFPPNVTVLTDIPYAKYRELLEGATAVLVPLKQHVFSSGQVVILEAMALGKPVIASRVLGSEDYIVDGTDGMLVTAGSAPELRQAMERIVADPSRIQRLGRAAVDKVLRAHTLEQYARSLLQVVDDLTSSDRNLHRR